MKSLSSLIVFLLCCSSFVLSQTVAGNSTISASPTDCTPSNCQALCNPGCATDMTCVLGTMKSCGVCPSSSCVSNALLGIPSDPSSTPGNSHHDDQSGGGADGSMIGGIVGGLLGGGILLAIALYCLFKRQKQKKNGLPFIVSRTRLDTTTSLSMSHTVSSPTPTPLRTTMTSPLSQSMTPSLASLTSAQRQQLHVDQQKQQPQRQLTPVVIKTASQARPASTASYLTEDDDDHSSLSSLSQRGSAVIASVAQNHQLQQASKSAQAFQVTRIKPQIMRISTVRVMDPPDSPSLSRSGSVRTVLTRDNSVTSLARSNTAPSRRPTKKGSDISNHPSVVSTGSSNTVTTEPTKRISAPMLATANPFHDRHSVIENDDLKETFKVSEPALPTSTATTTTTTITTTTTNKLS